MKLIIALCVFSTALFPALSSLGQSNPIKRYYEEGSLKAEGELSNQGKEGAWTFYYPNGRINSTEHYRHDSLQGTVQYYDEFQNVRSKAITS